MGLNFRRTELGINLHLPPRGSGAELDDQGSRRLPNVVPLDDNGVVDFRRLSALAQHLAHGGEYQSAKDTMAHANSAIHKMGSGKADGRDVLEFIGLIGGGGRRRSGVVERRAIAALKLHHLQSR